MASAWESLLSPSIWLERAPVVFTMYRRVSGLLRGVYLLRDFRYDMLLAGNADHVWCHFFLQSFRPNVGRPAPPEHGAETAAAKPAQVIARRLRQIVLLASFVRFRSKRLNQITSRKPCRQNARLQRRASVNEGVGGRINVRRTPTRGPPIHHSFHPHAVSPPIQRTAPALS